MRHTSGWSRAKLFAWPDALTLEVGGFAIGHDGEWTD
jgi:hypothetical protein